MITRSGLRKLLMMVLTVLATLTGVKVVSTVDDTTSAVQRLRDQADNL